MLVLGRVVPTAKGTAELKTSSFIEKDTSSSLLKSLQSRKKKQNYGSSWSTKGAGIQVERGCGGDWGIMQPARSISATFERGYGKLPKERGYGWILVFKVPTVSGDMGGI